MAIVALEETAKTLVTIIYNIHSYRALNSINFERRLNLWRVVCNSLFDTVAIKWCIIFGTDGDDQHIHWKKIVDVKDHDSFRSELLGNLKIDKSEWEEYWKELKDYRDQWAAHHDLSREWLERYPKLDIALNSSYFYLVRVNELLKAQNYTSDLDNFAKHMDTYIQHSQKMSGLLLEAINSVEDDI